MGGADIRNKRVVTMVKLEDVISANYPLRTIRTSVDDVLTNMDA